VSESDSARAGVGQQLLNIVIPFPNVDALGAVGEHNPSMKSGTPGTGFTNTLAY
jgi:hypothetical protein